MTTRERWERLAAQISEAALPVAVSSRTYPGGVTYFIGRTLDDGRRVEVHDAWWRKNPNVWIGYDVHIEGIDSIVTRAWPRTKKRSEVVAAVREAVSA